MLILDNKKEKIKQGKPESTQNKSGSLAREVRKALTEKVTLTWDVKGWRGIFQAVETARNKAEKRTSSASSREKKPESLKYSEEAEKAGDEVGREGKVMLGLRDHGK